MEFPHSGASLGRGRQTELGRDTQDHSEPDCTPGGYVDMASKTDVYMWGSRRGGTTWLQETINYRNDHRVMFEPFRENDVALFRHF